MERALKNKIHNYRTSVSKNVYIDTSDFAKNTDLAHLKSDVDKLDTEKLKNVTSNLSNLKSKVDKLAFDKSLLIPVDLSKLCDVVKK